MILRDTWKNYENFFERKALITGFWRQRQKKLSVQGSCHLLSITKSLKGMDHVWHMLRGVWHTGYQQHIKCGRLNHVTLHWAIKTTPVRADST